MGRRGFTLIELLVVIVIIAVLAAILFPVYTIAKENGRKASCLENCKQLSLAHQAYMSDNNGYTVPAYIGDVTGLTWYSFWAVSLQPYVKNIRVFFCPSKPVELTPAEIAAGNKTNILNIINVGYGMNLLTLSYAVPGRRPGFNGFTLRETQIPKPTHMIFLADCDGYYGVGVNGQAWPNWWYSPSFRHNGYANFVFMDGHAKCMTAITAFYCNCW